MKPLDGGVADAAVTEISQADIAPLVGLLHPLLEVLHCKLVDRQEGLTFRLFAALLVGKLMLLNFDMILAGKIAQCLPVGHLLMLHDEVHRAATFAAAETFADTLGRRHRERWRALVVKRAQTDIVGSATLEAHEVRHHLHNIGGIEYSLDSFSVNYRFSGHK